MPDQRDPREEDAAYLAWLRSQPCAVCGSEHNVEAAHLRVGSIPYDKRDTGMGERSSDRWALPLCRRCHDLQHSKNERVFWAERGIDPFALSLQYQVKR